MKKVLITGGSGSWGQVLTAKLLLNLDIEEIRIYSRNEYLQVMMARKFTDERVKFIIGDICDYLTLSQTCKGVDTIYHLAALKHVPLCEINVNQCIKTNIEGIQNVIRCAIENNVQKVIDVSSDKAAAPMNLYGMCKAVGEKLILAANNYSDTEFTCIRGGNALGSNGSVVQLFIDQIKKDNIIRITDERMTRFFLTLPQAVDLLLTAKQSTLRGGLFVMKMPSCSIKGLAKVVKYYHGNEETKIEVVGIRPGEKLHEVLLTEHECPNAYVFDQNYYVVSTEGCLLPKVDFKTYSSITQPLMTHKEIAEMLKVGGFL